MPKETIQESSIRGISVVLPIFNEASTINDVLTNVIEKLKAEGAEFEVIAVDVHRADIITVDVSADHSTGVDCHSDLRRVAGADFDFGIQRVEDA